MTLNEAFQELDLEPGAGAEGVRRAYLKLLKVRKPEVDPAGFQRLREAYELLGRMKPSSRDMASPIEVLLPEAAGRDEAPAELPPFSPAPETPPFDAQLFELARKDPVEAAEALTRLYEAAVRVAAVSMPPPRFSMRLGLDLVARGDPVRARSLHRAFDAWLVATGGEVQVIRAGGASELIVVRELMALMDDVDPRILAPMADAVLKNDFSFARGPLAQYAKEQGLSTASMKALFLARSPTLGELIYPGLTQKRVRRPPRERRLLRTLLRLAWVGFTIALLHNFFTEAKPEPNTPTSPVLNFTSAMRELARDHWIQPAAPAFVQAIQRAAERHDCSGALGDLRQLVIYADREPSPMVKADVRRVQRALDSMCPK